MKGKKLNRREFLSNAGIAAAGFIIVPRHVLGGKGYRAPSDIPNIAGIGVAARGSQVIRSMASMDVESKQEYRRVQVERKGWNGIITPPRHNFGGGMNQNQEKIKHANIYALCDVDHDYAAYMFKGYPKAKIYSDFRKLIDNEKELDGVVIATPDHNHAIIAAYAMAAGLAVYVEKPMCKTIYETRKLAALAKKYDAITQMGNQGHNAEGTYQTIEWIKSGKIGDVHEVHLSTNRPIWPQGYLHRPEGVQVPPNLDYDLWLGPAPEKPYNPATLHFNWRGLRDYGTGAMGDMGAHIFDAPILALDLGYPYEIQATTTPISDDFLPQAQVITYRFAARGNLPPVTVTWRDGGLRPARPEKLEENRALKDALYIGDKGMIMHASHGANPELIPEEPNFKVEPYLERPKNIYVDFCEAITEGRKTKNDFVVASKLTEIMLLGNIASMAQKMNVTLKYDAGNMRITNLSEANDFFHYEYRKGWKEMLESI